MSSRTQAQRRTGGPPENLQIGPLTRVIANNAKWRREDIFPARQIYADEVERILASLCVQDQLWRFLPRLRDNARARDAALAEARVAFFLRRLGFRIVEWEPSAKNGRVGEFTIQWRGGSGILVEVKAPSWQGELTRDELLGDRKAMGKYVDLEARAVDPLELPAKVIAKNAAPKFTEEQPNLVVIADDLFLSPVGTPHLEERIKRLVADPANRCIGALLFFKAEPYQGEIEYHIRFHPNKSALPDCQLPSDVVQGFIASSEADKLRRQRRLQRI